MPEIWETDKGLPPGLWLPTAEEDTERYRAENISPKDVTLEEAVEIGTFIVALIAWDQENSGRISTMPIATDFDNMRGAGYGLAASSLIRADISINDVQFGLHYYPKTKTLPARDDIIERFQWVAEYAYARDTGKKFGELTIEDAIDWASKRNYLPAYRKIMDILDGDTTILRRHNNMERRRTRAKDSAHEFYKAGAKVLADEREPITREEFRRRFEGKPDGISWRKLLKRFGSYTNYWLEYDCVMRGIGLNKDAMETLGVRWMWKNQGEVLSKPKISELSRQGRFVDIKKVTKNYGTPSQFRATVHEQYAALQVLAGELRDSGVDVRLVDSVASRYEAGNNFNSNLRSNKNVLIKLSSPAANILFITGILATGFDLLHDETYDMQLADFHRELNKLGVKSDQEKRFVFDLIPRIDPDEALAM